ncbi:hypothetical protein JCM17961_37130 [Endothiovibrio diazotrophicus]
MVVLALLAALTALAFSAVRHYGGVLGKLQQAGERFDQARQFAALREALHGLRLWLEPTRGIDLTGATAGTRYRPYFHGEPRRIAFCTTVPLLHRPDGEPYQVELSRAEDGGLRLRERAAVERARGYRLEAPWPDGEDGERWLPRWRVERFEFRDDDRWVARLEGRLPLAVRLSMRREDGEEQWVFAVQATDDRRWREALDGQTAAD